VPEGAWSGISRDVSGRERQLRDLPARRWREVEVHIVDLGIGVSHRDWSQDFVDRWLQPTRASAFDDPRDELAWLYGRLKRDDLPEPPPWG
jgi:maleylpyruvate isomerase